MTAVNFPDRLWLVVRESGDHHFVAKEPIGGIVEWSKGSDATVGEYQFVAVVHAPPLKKPK